MKTLLLSLLSLFLVHCDTKTKDSKKPDSEKKKNDYKYACPVSFDETLACMKTEFEKASCQLLLKEEGAEGTGKIFSEAEDKCIKKYLAEKEDSLNNLSQPEERECAKLQLQLMVNLIDSYHKTIEKCRKGT